jgi:hypothetical protein
LKDIDVKIKVSMVIKMFGNDVFSKNFNAGMIKDLIGGGGNDFTPVMPKPEKPKPEKPKPEEEEKEQSCGVHMGGWSEWSTCTYSWRPLTNDIGGSQYTTKKLTATNPDGRCADKVSDSADVVLKSLRDDGLDVAKRVYLKDGFYVAEITKSRNCVVATNQEDEEEEEPVDVDEGTTTGDNTESGSSKCGENEEKSDVADSDCECKKGYGREVGTNKCVELNMGVGGGEGSSSTSQPMSGVSLPSTTDTGGGEGSSSTSQPMSGVSLPSTTDTGGILLKVGLLAGVVAGAGYAYEKRDEISNYFKKMAQ